MGLDIYFYSSDHKLETTEDGVTIKCSQAEYLSDIGSLPKEWKIHAYIREDYFASGGNDDHGFHNVGYDITHLIPELIQAFSGKECEYLFPLFRKLLWELSQGKYIIYLGDY